MPLYALMSSCHHQRRFEGIHIKKELANLIIDCDILTSRLELGELPACLDQDECAEDNGGCEQDCVNTVGSHR